MTVAEFRTRMPAFASKPPSDPTIQRWLDLASSGPYFNAAIWGGYLDEGVANWVAHQLVMETGLGNTMATAGQVTQKGVGMMLDMMAKEPMRRTIYGQIYLDLRDVACAGPVAV